MAATGPVTSMSALARAALRAPLTRRARDELLFCLAGVLVGLAVLAVVVALLVPGTARSVIRAGAIVAVLLPLALATGLGRRLGAAHRRLAERLLGERVPAPPVLPHRGALGRLGAGLRDGPSWRALAYTLLKAPIAVAEGYAVFLWAAGLANLTYPFWWGLFRNHPPGVRLSPVLAGTPFPGRVLHIGTYPGTFLAFAAGLPQLQHVLRERVGARILPQGTQRHPVRPRGTPETKIDPARMQRLQRPELLRDDQRRVIRQHDAPRPDANRLCRLREVRDHDRRRCASDPVQVVVLGDPVPRVTQTLGAPHKINRVPERLCRRPAHDDRCDVEDRDGQHTPNIPTRPVAHDCRLSTLIGTPLTPHGFPRLETPSARIGRSSRTRF